MDFRKLKVGDIIKQGNDIIVGANFRDKETSHAAVEEFKSFFIEKFKNRRIRIVSDNQIIEAHILDVIVTSNIAEYKNFYFITDLKEIGKIRLNDWAEIID